VLSKVAHGAVDDRAALLIECGDNVIQRPTVQLGEHAVDHVGRDA